MKTIPIVSALILVLLVFSCESKQEEVEQLKSETIAIHDEVMPKMDDIMKLKRSLKLMQDSASSKEKESIQDLIIALEESDEAMMNWMRNYDPRLQDMTDAEKIEYLTKQKAAISEVSEKMKKSITEAEEFAK